MIQVTQIIFLKAKEQIIGMSANLISLVTMGTIQNYFLQPLESVDAGIFLTTTS